MNLLETSGKAGVKNIIGQCFCVANHTVLLNKEVEAGNLPKILEVAKDCWDDSGGSLVDRLILTQQEIWWKQRQIG